jgi:hypothetical protein
VDGRLKVRIILCGKDFPFSFFHLLNFKQTNKDVITRKIQTIVGKEQEAYV